jgi:hypothetical protein
MRNNLSMRDMNGRGLSKTRLLMLRRFTYPAKPTTYWQPR